MTATTLVAFDPKPELLGPVRTYRATAAILRGSCVSFDATGVSGYVSPSATTLGTFAGVALTSQATVGGPVSVAGVGTVLTVMMAADDSAIDAGHWVMIGAVAGTVIEYDPAIGTHAATQDTQSTAPIGIALEDSVVGGSTVGSKVKIQILPQAQQTASS